MKEQTRHYLAKFDASIDLEHQQRAREACRRAFQFEPVDELPYVLAGEPEGIDTDWPQFPYNDAFVDHEKMLLDQLRAPFIHNQLKDYQPLNIRCNYGTVILPSVFGAGYQLTETSLPWVHHLGSRSDIEALIDRGVPDLDTGLGGQCFETLRFYQEALSGYPNLGQAISVYHPDLQGPFDVAHLIWGPDILYALYDCPELVHELLRLVVETYRRWMRKWKALTGEGNEFTTHWNLYIKGGIMVRDDTPVMLSPAHYEEFVKPYDQELLDEFGGCIHYCGKGDGFIASMCRSRNLFGVNTSQPELNDVTLLVQSARANRVVLLGLREAFVPPDIVTGAIVIKTHERPRLTQRSVPLPLPGLRREGRNRMVRAYSTLSHRSAPAARRTSLSRTRRTNSPGRTTDTLGWPGR